jgi:hypothetical protein
MRVEELRELGERPDRHAGAADQHDAVAVDLLAPDHPQCPHHAVDQREGAPSAFLSVFDQMHARQGRGLFLEQVELLHRRAEIVVNHRMGIGIPFGEQLGKVGDMIGIFMRQNDESDFRHQDQSTRICGPGCSAPLEYPGSLRE